MVGIVTLNASNPVNLDTYAIEAFVDEQADRAHEYVLQLAAAVSDITPPTINPEWPVVDSAPLPVTTTPPTLREVVWSVPGLPADFTATLEVDDFVPEPFEEEAPELFFGTAPAEFTDTIPDAPGVNTTWDDPELTLNLPAAPDLLSINVSRFDGVTIPSFDYTIPELNIAAPNVTPYTPGTGYVSSLLTAIQAELLDRIQNGGTGLNADVENAIWDRGREREYRQQGDAIRDLERMETLGYSLPTGVYADARLKIITETNYSIANHSREVMIEQAKLEQQNVQQSLDLAVRLEGLLIDQNNAVEQRMFEAAKYATQAAMEVYNARVRAYSAYLDAFKARVQIYEAQIRGEIARVEAYQAEIQAEEAKARVNTALVEQYKARIQGELANVEVFRARIDAIRTKAEIEKLKVEIYGEQVRGFSARVNAYTAGVEAFKTRIQAETAKQDAFTSHVQAYRAEVEANVAAIGARVDEYKARLQGKQLEWEGYKSRVEAEAAKARAIADSNRSLTDSYASEVRAVEAYNDALTKQWQAALDQAQRTAEIGIQAAKANAELYVTTRSLALDAAKVGAQVSAQLGASALGVMSMSESYNVSRSESASNSFSYSESYSQIESITVSA